MAVTIKDVAALAGVSPSTVSRTCKNNPSISTETKEKVRKAMIELGYEVNFQASNLASQYSRTIGIILPPSAREVYENAFYLQAMRGISHYCNQRQYMSTVVTGQDEKVKLFGSLEIPAIVFKLWWIIPVAFLLLPLNATIENLITLVLDVVFLGCTYAKMYARLENKQENETQAIGCVSGFIQIIAVVKFLMYK